MFVVRIVGFYCWAGWLFLARFVCFCCWDGCFLLLGLLGLLLRWVVFIAGLVCFC